MKLYFTLVEAQSIRTAIYLNRSKLVKDAEDQKVSGKIKDIVDEQIVCLDKIANYLNEEIRREGE